MMTEIRNFIEICGEMVILFFETVKASFVLKNRYSLIFKNIITMGIRTLPIAMIMSFFVGMVLSLQSGYQLNKFGLNDILGAIVFLSLLKELAPVQTAVLMLAKVGTSITAEIGSMRVSEEIETLNIMGINIINYLIMPRFIACIFSTIILVIYADIIGLIGGAIVANYYFGLSYSKFFDSAFQYVNTIDLVGNLLKAFLFGILIANISSYFGLNVKLSSEGIGEATTNTVVVSFIVLLICNYFVTKLLLYL